jgi:hypothetical protein
MMLSSFVLIFLFVSFVNAADNWDDFTNNLATDLVYYICGSMISNIC